ncbi:hypothetical protein AAHB34_07765 [Paenarthrobacter ureafaciens]
MDEVVDLAGWTWYLLVFAAALPTIVSTLFVLHATPRSHLRAVDSTVLGHFFVRFLALVAAFMVWAASVVMSASISTTVQTLIGDSEKEVTALGFNLMLAAVPLVLSVLWMAFIIRCAWFLRRLRGWREVPLKTRVPKGVPAPPPGPEEGSCGFGPSGTVAGCRAGNVFAGSLRGCRGTHHQRPG